MPSPRTRIPIDEAVTTRQGPRVSIIVRTHLGRLGFLREAVESALAQDYGDVEIVVVEDGACSASDWIHGLPPMPGRGVVYRSLPKGGRCRTGNAGLELCTGRFSLFLDDDDLLFPDHVSRLVTPLLQDESLAAAYSLAYEVPTRVYSRHPLRYEELMPYVAYRQPFCREELQRRNYMAIQSVLFRRELYERYGGFREDLDCLEDWELWRRFASERDFVLVDCVTSLYRVAGDSESARRRQLLLDESRRRLALNGGEAGGGDSDRPGPAPSGGQSQDPLPLRLRRTISKNPLLYRLYWHGRQWYYRRKRAA